jgi:arginyl-tRNA--protein-N-Asp/Glu arginylyltransferase
MKETDTREIIPPDFVRRMKFYLTSPQPCPYLPGKMERKVFANLAVEGAVGLNDSLTRSGFRRSQTIAYRPACKTCGACRSVRIDVAAFQMSKRWRRVLARNADLEREANPARATREQFRLLKRYLDRRHPGGGMTDMEIRDYAGMVDASPVHTAVFEYRNRLNGKPGDDGLYLVMVPRNSAGQFVPTTGKMTIVVEETLADGTVARIGRYEYTAEELKEHLEPVGSAPGLHIPIRWSERVPSGTSVDVYAKFSMADGTTMVNRRSISLRKIAAGGPSTWTPR